MDGDCSPHLLAVFLWGRCNCKFLYGGLICCLSRQYSVLILKIIIAVQNWEDLSSALSLIQLLMQLSCWRVWDCPQYCPSEEFKNTFYFSSLSIPQNFSISFGEKNRFVKLDTLLMKVVSFNILLYLNYFLLIDMVLGLFLKQKLDWLLFL